jgi:uncharacterized protein (TIGR01244 family)
MMKKTPAKWTLHGSFAAARALILLAALLCPGSAGIATAQSAGALQAPFGDKVGPRIPFYDRVAPQVATSASLDRLGVLEAKGVGFRSIIDLQPASEPSAAEQKMAEFALLRYYNLPIADALPTNDQVAVFAGLIENPHNQPVLVHGISVDQAAAMWALYRAAKGVPPEVALGDGLTAGLGISEPMLRQRLGMPASAN